MYYFINSRSFTSFNKGNFMKIFKKQNQNIKQAISSIGSYFIGGLVVLAPVMITYWFLTFLFNIIKVLLAPFKTISFPLIESFPHHEVIIGIILIFIAGIFLKSFIIQSFIQFI